MTQALPSPSDTMIPWRRFWSGHASPIHQEEGGLLVHYEPHFGRASSSGLVLLEDLIRGESPLLFLLGDPGMGKTTELQGAKTLIRELAGPEDHLVEVDVRSIRDFEKFITRESKSEPWQKWLNGTGRMTLLLDGLDEGLVLVADLLVDLKSFLREQKTDRIRLILSTRFFDHVMDKAKELWALWQTPEGSRLPVYTLCPLREEEVKEAATHYGCDPSAFFEAVLERNVTGFAARPVTLFFLLRQFDQEKTLSSTRQEIYEKGISALLDEADGKRSSALVDATPRPGFTRPETPLKDRVEAASNLAAQLLLSGSAGIWEPMAVAFEECPEGNLSLDEMTDSTPGSPMARRTLIEVVHSALFKSVGIHRYEFAHPTFAEYLAAKRLDRMPLVQLKSLLCHRDIRGEYIIPQLGDLAAWVAIFHPEFRELMLAVDPQMLLRGEVRTFPVDLKKQLVERLLEGAQEWKFQKDYAQMRYFNGLNHPDLADQLRPWITGIGRRQHSRGMALSFVEECRTDSLAPEMAALVADEREGQMLRHRAAISLSKIVTGEQLAYLEPFARGEVGPDPAQFIKGFALRRLVPERWKLREALPHLDSIANPSFTEFQKHFIFSEMAAALEDEDVVPVLEWIRGHEYFGGALSGAERMTLSAIARSIPLLDHPDVAAAVAEIFLDSAEKRAFQRAFEMNPVVDGSHRMRDRQVFFRALLSHPAFHAKEGLLFSLLGQSGCTADDIEWLLDELPHAPSEQQAPWAEAVRQLSMQGETEACWNKLVETMRTNDALRVKLDDLRAWDLDEPRAQAAKAKWDQEQERLNYKEPTEEETHFQISYWIENLREGGADAWLHLLWWFSYAIEITQHSNLEESSIWKELTEAERDTCFVGARQFLIEISQSDSGIVPHTPESGAARSTLNLIGEGALDDAGLKAALSGEPVKSLVKQIYTNQMDIDDAEIALLYRIDERACMDGVIELLFEDFADDQMTFDPRRLKPYWNEDLAARIREKIDTLESPDVRAKAINTIAPANEVFATEEARRFLEMQKQADASDMSEALITALRYSPAETFQSACEIMGDDDALRKRVWAEVLHDRTAGGGRWMRALNVRELGQLYEILHRVLPGPYDIPWGGAGMDSENEARRKRDSIPDLIAGLATDEACRELLRLASVLPDNVEPLHRSFQDCINNLRRSGWVALTPQRTKEVLQRESARLLNGVDDLLELVLESLGRIQKLLTGQELPAASDLWSWTGGGNQRKDFRHKDEESLSDYLARELARDIGTSSGVVVNREVQPVRGLRTDIHVTASHPGAEKFTVVIEVKGCWHGELDTSLETQLVDRYLKGKLRCGIYLVGWFKCAGWQQMDHKLASQTLDQARAEVAGFAEDYRDGKNPLIRVEPFVMDCSI